MKEFWRKGREVWLRCKIFPPNVSNNLRTLKQIKQKQEKKRKEEKNQAKKEIKNRKEAFNWSIKSPVGCPWQLIFRMGSSGAEDKFCLRWNDFESNVSSSFKALRQKAKLFDVSLVLDGDPEVKVVQAHKVILAACSPFFESLFSRSQNHVFGHPNPLIYLRGVRAKELNQILDFMYHGEVNVAQDELNSFLAVAEDLKIKGLTQNSPDSGRRKPLKASALKREREASENGKDGQSPKKRSSTPGSVGSGPTIVTTEPDIALDVPRSIVKTEPASSIDADMPEESGSIGPSDMKFRLPLPEGQPDDDFEEDDFGFDSSETGADMTFGEDDEAMPGPSRGEFPTGEAGAGGAQGKN